MNPRQKAFADEYIKSGNATQSAIKAGYSDKWASDNSHRLTGNDGIKEYIKERIDEMDKTEILNQTEILKMFSNIAKGSGVHENSSTSEQLKALELLAKIYQMFTEKLQVEASTVTIINDLNE